MKDMVDFYNRYLTKEERDEEEKKILFKNRYKDTFDAIGDPDDILEEGEDELD